jgi:hypothetical protein
MTQELTTIRTNVLKKREKDNPSPFCRGSYLMSNATQMAYCWGRIKRFPEMETAYLAEMKLAIGDVITQLRLIENEQNMNHYESTIYVDTRKTIDFKIALIIHIASKILISKTTKECNYIDNLNITTILMTIEEICKQQNWNFEEIEHLGFTHTIEKFEQYEKENWK